MKGVHLLALYLVVGAGAALVVARRARGGTAARLGSALAAWLLWPLWAPIALAPTAPARRATASDPIVLRLHHALDEVLAAAEGSAFAALLSSEAALRIRREIDRAGARIAELGETLARPGFDPAAAELRVAELERAGTGASARALANARLHRDGVARLARVRDQDRRALDDLAGALEALRSQIVLARVAGPGRDDVVSELWARVEGLGAALDTLPSDVLPREDDAAAPRGNGEGEEMRPDPGVPSPEEVRA